MDKFEVQGIIDTDKQTWISIDDLIVVIAESKDLIPKEFLIGELLKLRTSLLKIK